MGLCIVFGKALSTLEVMKRGKSNLISDLLSVCERQLHDWKQIVLFPRNIQCGAHFWRIGKRFSVESTSFWKYFIFIVFISITCEFDWELEVLFESDDSSLDRTFKPRFCIFIYYHLRPIFVLGPSIKVNTWIEPQFGRKHTRLCRRTVLSTV